MREASESTFDIFSLNITVNFKNVTTSEREVVYFFLFYDKIKIGKLKFYPVRSAVRPAITFMAAVSKSF